jgi:hypothetical protein
MNINSIQLEYFHHPYNQTHINERRIEIPIAMKFLQLVNHDCVEVGCVTPYYYQAKHKVIDLYDRHPSAQNIDALTYDYSNQNCLSISTIEHFGEIYNDPSNSGKYFDKELSFKGLKLILEKVNKYLISFPIGTNLSLDESVKNSNLPFFILKRDYDNNWSLDETNSFNYKYGLPFHSGNAICVITNLEEFHKK